MVDPKQLLLMTAITTGVCAIFMFVNWLLNRGMPGVRDWLLFAVLTGFGCSLLAANTLPLTWSIFIPNIAMFLGLFYLARGVELFLKRQHCASMVPISPDQSQHLATISMLITTLLPEW